VIHRALGAIQSTTICLKPVLVETHDCGRVELAVLLLHGHGGRERYQWTISGEDRDGNELYDTGVSETAEEALSAAMRSAGLDYIARYQAWEQADGAEITLRYPPLEYVGGMS